MDKDDLVSLKPCPSPWCNGGKPHYMTWINHGTHIVHCIDCGARTPIKQTKDEAITTWNTRIESSQSELLEALREIAEDKHKAGCKFEFAPRNECPTCPSAATIAKRALKRTSRHG
jgi:hypothetical protein